MNKKEFLKLKEREVSELSKMVDEKKTELMKVKMDVLGGKEKNLKKAKGIKKEIAQILTLINIK